MFKTQLFPPCPPFAFGLPKHSLKLASLTQRHKTPQNTTSQMMMARMSKPRKATGMRRASSYVPVVAGSVDHKSYPSLTSSTIGAIHDVAYYQSMMSNPGNYSVDSQLDVIEVINDKIVERSIITEPECQSYLSVRPFGSPYIRNDVGCTALDSHHITDT
jgi:hypothetical protein